MPVTNSDGLVLPGSVVFDLDGTLLDSAAGMALALGRLLADCDGRPVSLVETINGIGKGRTYLVQRSLEQSGAELPTAWTLDDAVARYTGYYEEAMFATLHVYHGAGDVVRDLAEAGVRIGICTNKGQDLAQRAIEAMGMADDVQAVVGRRPGVAMKPDPEPFRICLAEMGGHGGDAVYVGDSVVDVALARAVHVPVVITSHGYAIEPLESLAADAIVADLADLPVELARLSTDHLVGPDTRL